MHTPYNTIKSVDIQTNVCDVTFIGNFNKQTYILDNIDSIFLLFCSANHVPNQANAESTTTNTR